MHVYLSLLLSTDTFGLDHGTLMSCIKCLGFTSVTMKLAVFMTHAFSVVKHRIGIVGCLPKISSTPCHLFIRKGESILCQ